MVALAIVLVGIIWATIQGLVRSKIKSASCVDVTGKVSINNRNTCYNSTTHQLIFSISRGDVNISGILVGVASEGNGLSFKILSSPSSVQNVALYPSGSASVAIPAENGGVTYSYNMTAGGFTGAPDSLKISPTVGSTQCGTSDQLNQIDNCATLA